jgi:hypothetical protein
MPSNRKITLPKKATGAAPGLVSPAQWNRVVEALAALLAQTLENSPQSGADIGIRKSAGGWVPYLKRRVGAEGGSLVPLHVLLSRPQYIVNPGSPPAEGSSRLWVEWGSINNVVADNWDSYFDLSADAVIYADITLNTTSTYELIASWEIATGAAVPEQPAWPPSGPPGGAIRPSKLYILLAQYVHTTPTVINNGAGSLLVGEYVTGLYDDYSTLGAVLSKALTWSRVPY